jgi:hypothetical protein
MREYILPILLTILFIFLLNPMGVYMKYMDTAIYFVTVIIVLILLLITVWRKKPSDEREIIHEANASHASYFIGQIILLIAIFSEKMVMNHINPWLVAVFLGMTLAELVVRKWQNKCR